MRQFDLADVRKSLQILIWVTLGLKKRRESSAPDAQLVKQNDRVLLIRSLLNHRMFWLY